MSRYIDPTSDYGFKRLFGQEDSKEILKTFLEDVLELKRPIQELTYLPKEQIPNGAQERIAVYDIHCVDTMGQRFIVEMQKHWQRNFKERTLYYVATSITQQAKKGRWDFELLPVYCISVMNFSSNVQTTSTPTRYIEHVQLMNTKEKAVFYHKLALVFIELPNFNKPLAELTNRVEQWCYLLKYLPTLSDIPAELAEEPFTQAFQLAEQASMSEQERRLYAEMLKRESDEYSIITSAEWKKAMEIAQTMVNQGMAVETICQITRLPLSDVQSLMD